ncbi:MAG: baseplate J/gp47 family protein, partial [Actinomycetota bacterium]|nr:baseplate J/gp47 family protein [Actinomycetota bacterium]
ARVVLFFDGGTTPAEEKEVAEIRVRDDHVVLVWTQPVLGTAWTSAARAYAFTGTFRLFGHNAPAEPITLTEDASSLSGVKWTQSTTSYAYPHTSQETSADPATGLLCLDGRHEGVAVGDRLLVADTASGGRTTLVTVRFVEQIQDSLGGVTETVTRLRVAPAPPAMADRRTVVVYRLAGPRILFWDSRYPASLTSTEVHLPGRRSGDGVEVGRTIEAGTLTEGVVIRPVEVEVGRTVLLTDDSGTALVATITAAPSIEPANAVEGSFCHLVLSLDVQGTPDLDTESVVLLGNVAKASHGETARDEALGSGDASQTFQRFGLRKKPITYVPTAAGVASSLRVEVGGVEWSEVPSLYGRGASDRVLTTRIGDDGTVTVQFGDGVTGALVPTGQANVSATYRVGTGLAGRVWAGSMTTALDRPPGLQGVTNPLAATGGADPETMDRARGNAPRTVRTFGRVVSLRDFADEVTATGEVAKAHATWVWDGLDRAVFLTVASQEGAPFTADDLERLGAALTAARDPNHRLMMANFTPVPVRFRATVTVAPDRDAAEIAAAARGALLAAWSFDALGLGQSLHLSDTYRVLHDVEGVVAVEIKELKFEQPSGITDPEFDLDLTRRAVIRLADGTPQPLQGHLRIFPAIPDPAVPGLVRPAELAIVESPTQDVVIDSAGGSGS